MKRKIAFFVFLLAVLVSFLASCRKDFPLASFGVNYVDVNSFIPRGFPASIADLNLRADNPLTLEGIALGRRLFYDKLLSGNNQQSCGSCHIQKYAFTNGPSFNLSTGADGISRTLRNAPATFNLMWSKTFTWDGAQPNLEEQLIGPITSPVEMNQDLKILLEELRADANYPYLFKKAFGTDSITIALVQKAIAQFERTIVSGSSKFDLWLQRKVNLDSFEFAGFMLFDDQKKGDCNHCHSKGGTFTNFDFKHNGLDTLTVGSNPDVGRYGITHFGFDFMSFKTPTLRNIELTTPYMHDGRFQTLEEVLDFYDGGFHYNKNLDVNMALLPKHRLTANEKKCLIRFLKTLTDVEFINNPVFSDPF